jgi:hypothetical protein
MTLLKVTCEVHLLKLFIRASSYSLPECYLNLVKGLFSHVRELVCIIELGKLYQQQSSCWQGHPYWTHFERGAAQREVHRTFRCVCEADIFASEKLSYLETLAVREATV